MNGFPINIPYTDVEEAVKTVLETSIHENNDPKAEFAVAVHVVPYPNLICSIWIYVASVTSK